MGSGANRDVDGLDMGERLVKQAYQNAGVGPEDISLAENGGGNIGIEEASMCIHILESV